VRFFFMADWVVFLHCLLGLVFLSIFLLMREIGCFSLPFFSFGRSSQAGCEFKMRYITDWTPTFIKFFPSPSLILRRNEFDRSLVLER